MLCLKASDLLRIAKYNYNREEENMNITVTDAQQQALQKNAQQWLQSPEGKEAIQKALQEAKAVTARLQEERRVELKTLQEPFTV